MLTPADVGHRAIASVTKEAVMSCVTKASKASALFIRAAKEEERGNLRSAFRLMLTAAKLGDLGAQVNLGNYYDDGKAIHRNRRAALYWYRRAYKRGYSTAAYNIGVLWRNEKKFKRALSWFHRAVELGDKEANLEIGEYYLHNENDPRKAIQYFERVTPSRFVSEAGVEEAAKLLRAAKKMLKMRPPDDTWR
jgi:TPR repeat protein